MKILDEIKKPFNIITLLLTIISIVLSVVFYLNSQKNKDLSYLINEPASIIYDSKNSSSKIKLFEKDSVVITDNVYLLTGTLWNSGELPIYLNDIRKDIMLEINDSNRILDFKINKQNDSEVANFELNEIENNTLKLNWDYFDPQFGLNFQIIYLGNENPEFNVTGKILGISNINKVKQEDKTKSSFWIFADVSYGVMIFALIFILKRNKRRNGKIDWISLVALMFSITIVIYITITKFLMTINIPL